MSKEFKNIDDLFRSEFDQKPVDVPESVKSGIDAGIGFGEHPVDDVYKSEMTDEDVTVPASVKREIDKSIWGNRRRVWSLAIPSALLLLLFGVWMFADFGEEENKTNKLVQTHPEEGQDNTPLSNEKSQSGLNNNEDQDENESPDEIDVNQVQKANTEKNEDTRPENVSGNNITSNRSNGNNISVSSSLNADDVQNNVSAHKDIPTDHSTFSDGNKTVNPSKKQATNEQDDEVSNENNSDQKNVTEHSVNSGLTDGEKGMKDDSKQNKSDDIATDNSTESSTDPKTKNKNDKVSSEVNTSTDSESNNLEVTSENKESSDKDPDMRTDEKQTEIQSETVVKNPEEEKSGEPEKQAEENEESPDIAEMDKQDTVSIDKPREKYQPWFVTAGAGVNLTKSFYTGSTFEEQMLYETSMEDKTGQEFYVDAKYRFKKGLTIGSGLQFNQFNENYSFVDEYWDHDSTGTPEYTYETEYEYGWEVIYDTTMTPIDSNWVVMDSMEVVSDTTYTYTHDSTFVSNYNESGMMKATYFSIPLHLGAQMVWKKFRFDIMATIRYNILMNARGKYYQDGTFIGFTKKSNNIYRKTYFDFQFSGAVHYNIWRNLFISAVVKYRPVWFNHAFKGTSFNKQMHYTHLGLGVSLKL